MKKIIDISYYQDPNDINYDRLFSQVDGVIIRLGYGTGVESKGWGDSPDPAFERHYAEIKARRPDMPLGAYHYLVEYKPVDEQIELIKKAMDGKDLVVPVYENGKWVWKRGFHADIEIEGGAPRLTRSTVIDYVNKARAFTNVGMYTGAWAWDPIMGTNNPFSDLALWVASYTYTPIIPNGWNDFWLWQWTSSGRLSGYPGNLDMNKCPDEIWDELQNTQPEPPEPDKVLFRAKVLVTALNVRKGPNVLYDKVGLLYKDDIVDVYEERHNWFRIGVDRWCSGYPQYMEKIPIEQPMTLEERVADNTRRIEALEAKC